MLKSNSVNRESKDRLFKLIFGRPDHKEWTLSLYNAVNGSNYDNPEDIEITTIENAVYMGMTNDVSFLVNGTMNLFEHQSTYNPNMPVRMLIYAGMLYNKYVENPDRNINLYSSKPMEFPVPKLVCFYNGTDEKEDNITLSLRDLLNNSEASDIDVRVTMRNINYGHSEELLESCRALRDYSLFVEKYRESYRETGNPEQAVEMAIGALDDDSPIKQFLLDNRAEVTMSVITEYDEERTMKMFREEWYTEGKRDAAVRMLEKGIEPDVIEWVTGISVESLK